MYQLFTSQIYEESPDFQYLSAFSLKAVHWISKNVINKAVIVENIAKVNKYAEFYYLGGILDEIIVWFT